MERKVYKHQKALQAFDRQRKAWLMLSALVTIAVGKIIFSWATIEDLHIMWVLVSAGLLVSVLWWYWTMRLIRELIQHQKEEVELFNDVVECIREIQKEVKNLTR
jgi:hypothetical protein